MFLWLVFFDLFDIHLIFLNNTRKYLNLQDGAFIEIGSTVIRSGEDSDDWWYFGIGVPTVKVISLEENFMSSDDTGKLVFLEKVVG